MMDCFVGAATGAFKSVSLRDNSFTNITPISELEPRRHEITALSFSDTDQTEILIAQLDRSLRLYDSLNGGTATLFTVAGQGRIRGVHVTEIQDILTACEKGTVRVWDKSGKEKASALMSEGEVLSMDVSERPGGGVVIGGRNILLRMLDVTTLKETWKSKNVRNDWLDLEVPIWDTQARFMHDDRLIATSTGTHEIRYYDTRAQKKPVQRMEWLEEPISSLAVSRISDWTVIAGNTKGEMAQFDLRKMVPNAKFKGQAGAIRCIKAHPTAPLIASCGIDRFVRVHNLQTKKLVHKVYCKARLNALLMRDELSIAPKVKEEDREDWALMESKKEDELVDDKEIKMEPDDEDEDVWKILPAEETRSGNGLSNINDEPQSKRKKMAELEGEENVANQLEGERKGIQRKRKESEEDDDDIEEVPVKKLKGALANKRKAAEARNRARNKRMRMMKKAETK